MASLAEARADTIAKNLGHKAGEGRYQKGEAMRALIAFEGTLNKTDDPEALLHRIHALIVVAELAALKRSPGGRDHPYGEAGLSPEGLDLVMAFEDIKDAIDQRLDLLPDI